MTTALNALSSAHLDIDAGALGGKSSSDVKFAAGRTVATDAHLSENGRDIEVITAGGKSYAKLPSAGAKPWLPVDANSSNPTVASIASTVSTLGAATSLDTVTALIAGAKSVTGKGKQRTDGVATTRYSLTLDSAHVTGPAAVKQLLALVGGKPIPVELWLDARYRPVEFVITVPLGSGVPITVHVSKYDGPLTITAPPADQIATS